MTEPSAFPASKIQIHLGDGVVVHLASVDGAAFPLPLSGFNPSAKAQLLENHRYEYSVNGGELLEIPGVVLPSHLASKNTGQIVTQNYVGHLQLKVLKDGGSVETVPLEVQSSLLGYQEDFKQMVSDLVSEVADIQMQISSPSSGWVRPGEETSKTRQQRLFFLLGLIRGERFSNAVNRVIDYPNHIWIEQRESGDIRRPCRIGASQMRSLASAGNRIPVPASSPLHAILPSLPRRIEFSNKTESIDTPENRFVKFALTFFRHELEAFRRELGDSASPTLTSDLESMERTLNGWLGKSFFRDVGMLRSSCFSSPLLQRREGYKEILLRWIQYKLGCSLDWNGSEDVYHAGQRNIAALYEYWCFFKLLNVVRTKFGVKIENTALIELCDAKAGELPMKLHLKAGNPWSCIGTYVHNDVTRHLNMKFSYNRTFANDESKAGADKMSWTLELRPDYTFSFWPHKLSEEDATKHDLVTHVHFDAKYKAKEILEALQNDSADKSVADEESEQDRKNRLDAKRIDLIKMHCYRDAIHRTAGAYVLYPGNRADGKTFQGFHEIIPGLGAFPLRPNAGDEGEIEKFLDKVLGVLCDRLSQWENYTYQKHTVHDPETWWHGKNSPTPSATLLPELTNCKRINPTEKILESARKCAEIEMLENETVFGTYHGKDHLNWILRTGLYNLPIDSTSDMTETEAVKMKRAVLAPPSRGKTPMKVMLVTEFVGKVTADDLKNIYGYFKKTGHKEYWVWRVTVVKKYSATGENMKVE